MNREGKRDKGKEREEKREKKGKEGEELGFRLKGEGETDEKRNI
jgi:hypothetical protein